MFQTEQTAIHTANEGTLPGCKEVERSNNQLLSAIKNLPHEFSSGAEAMFADLGYFTAFSIRLPFAFVIYPCLVIQYMGQAAFLSKNLQSVHNSFYDSIPEPVFWPVFGCFPCVKAVHTSKHIFKSFT